jgi:outer membrane protein TolC
MYDYAVQNWQAVGNEWLKLFWKPKADEAVSKALSEHHSSQSRSDDKNAARMVVLVVDEARELLTATVNGVSHFVLLHNALVNANIKIGRTCPRSGIFRL